jgi:hypothetical protein
MSHSYRDLAVWLEAKNFAVAAYRLSERFQSTKAMVSLLNCDVQQYP